MKVASRRALRLALFFAAIAVVLFLLLNWASVHASNLPGPTLGDCGEPGGERIEICTPDQLAWEHRVLIVAVAWLAASGLSVLALAVAAGLAVASAVRGGR